MAMTLSTPPRDRQDRRSEEDLRRDQKRHGKHALVGRTDAGRDDQADRRAGHRREPVVRRRDDRPAPVDLGRNLAAERLAQKKPEFGRGPEDRDLDGEQQGERRNLRDHVGGKSQAMPPLEVEHRPLLDDFPEAGHEPEDHHADAHQRQPLERAARIDDLPIGGDGDGIGQGIADDSFGRRLPEMGEQLRLAVEELSLIHI